MPPWLYIWLFRIGRGERIEKATSADYRWWFGVFFLFLPCVGLFVKLSSSILNQGTSFAVWLAMVAFGVSYFFITKIWTRFVPAMISFALGLIVWAVAFWMAWHQ